jgi:DNA-binding CsgD family transcriptional regulator
VRVPSRSGEWYLFCAALLDDRSDGRVSVIVHPMTEPSVPRRIVDSHELTAREREVTRLVLRGCSTHEIASSLHLSPYTVQDHLKGVFAKLQVRSRRELVARLFAEHYAPRLEAGTRVGPDGWFAD